MIGDPILELDNKLVQGGLPVTDWHFPFPGCGPDRQESHFQGRVIMREDLALTGRLADHAVE